MKKLRTIAATALALIASGLAVTNALLESQKENGELTCADYETFADSQWSRDTGVAAAVYMLLAPQCHGMKQFLTCHHLANGNDCRSGLEYGPGLGGVHADGSYALCEPDVGDKPFPCGTLFDRPLSDEELDPNTVEGQRVRIDLLKAVLAAPKE